MTYILAHDIGTSGDKAVLYDIDGRLTASETVEYPTLYPAAGCAEQNSSDWWGAVCASTKRLIALSGVNPADIAAVSFSAQMMGCLPLDKHGDPLRPSMIWADNRSSEQAERLGERIGARRFFRIAGARPSASYYGSKIMWLRENEPDIYDKTAVVMQAKDYIIFRLTGEIVTDYSDASGSNLYDITAKRWSDELIEAAGLRGDILPPAFSSTTEAGRITASAAAETGLAEGTPVIIGAGDGSAAAVGSGVWREGSIYSSVGSSAWVSMASAQPVFDEGMQTYNLIHPDGVLYAPCCSMQAAGYSFNRLRANFFSPEASYDDMTAEAMSSPAGADGLLYLPYLMGERCPRWNPEAYGSIIGLTLKNSRADIVRAVMEGVAYNLRCILDIFGPLAYKNGTPTDIIMVSGCAKSDRWAQIFADVFGRRVLIPRNTGEATSIGAAICGGVGAGLFDSFGVCERFNGIAGSFEPDAGSKEVYDVMFDAFNLAYKGTEPVFPLLTKVKKAKK